MFMAEDKKKNWPVHSMKAWVSGGIATLSINLASNPCSELVELSRQVHTPVDSSIRRPYWVPMSRLRPMFAYKAVNVGFQCHIKYK
jgi:hypothetical protein